MKKCIFAATFGFAATLAAHATLYSYDFGTGTGTHSSGASTTFLPDPAAGGGTARVRIGTGAGAFSLVNPGDALGSATELQATAPTGTSFNKFSIYDISSPSDQFYLAFTLKLTGGSSGSWSVFTGDGNMFSDNNNFTGAQTFNAMRWEFGPGAAITEESRQGGIWVGMSDLFSQDTAYRVEIYANNGSSSANYLSGAYTVSAGAWDLWINGSRVGVALGKAQLPSEASIDSFAFIGSSSTGNAATLLLDDIQYATTFASVVPEPAAASLLGLGLLLLRRIRR